MVPISTKPSTHRTAIARGRVTFSNPTPYHLIAANAMKKGDVLTLARIAGIMGSKKTSELVPLCHPIAITSVSVDVLLAAPSSSSRNTPSTSDAERDGQMTRGEPSKAREDAEGLLGRFGGVWLEARVECDGKTGVEMEALTAVSVAALTVYDMCKAVDKGMSVEAVRVVLKEGGRSGRWCEEGHLSSTGYGDVK
ncbi:MAG: hypothetical protein M1835_005117 [Candelina submexicana]|nr:MAG: hypothetical protein M1835_005117 [Candelina submexicana]